MQIIQRYRSPANKRAGISIFSHSARKLLIFPNHTECRVILGPLLSVLSWFTHNDEQSPLPNWTLSRATRFHLPPFLANPLALWLMCISGGWKIEDISADKWFSLPRECIISFARKNRDWSTLCDPFFFHLLFFFFSFLLYFRDLMAF